MALLGGAWTAAGVALYLILPLAAPSVLALAVIAPLAWSWAAEQRPAWRMPPPALALLALATLYLLINASWSPSQARPTPRWTMFAVVIAVLYIAVLYLPAMPPEALRAMGVGLLAGLAAAAAILCFEALSNGSGATRAVSTPHCAPIFATCIWRPASSPISSPTC